MPQAYKIVNLPCDMHFAEGDPPVKVIDLQYKRRQETMHTHDFHEIVLVESGSGRHVTETRITPIFHGDIFLVKPGHAHTYEEIKALKIVNILFLPEAMDFPRYDLMNIPGYKYFFESDISQKHALNLNSEQLNTVNEIILEMRHHQSNHEQGYKYFMHLCFMRLVGAICGSYSTGNISQKTDVPRLIRVIRFMEHRFQEKIQMTELAAIVNMSPSALLRAFTRELKETPINYLVNLRLEKAAKMLRETGKSINQVSYAVGFHDSNYFSKMFRRKYACSPREYRKNNH
jgi:AraC-like DNA-binding protein